MISSCAKKIDVVEDSSKFLVDSIIIEKANLSLNPIIGTNLSYNTAGNSVIIWYFSFNKIYKYNISTKSIVDSIDLSYYKKLNFYHAYFYIDSDNKFYLLNRGHENTISLLENNEIKKIKFLDSSKPQNYIYTSYTPLAIDGNILLCKLPYYFLPDPEKRKKYFSSKILSVFNIKDSFLIEKRNFAPFPKEYQSEYFYTDRPIACKINDSMVYYNFPNKNIIYKYNVNSGQVEHYIIRNVIENNLPPFNTDSITSLAYAVKYAISSNNFTSLSYDKYSNHLLLMQTLAVNYAEDSMGHMPLYENKPTVANVLDNSYNCIKKIKFNHQIYCETIFFNNNKLYIPFVKKSSLIIYIYEI